VGYHPLVERVIVLVSVMLVTGQAGPVADQGASTLGLTPADLPDSGSAPAETLDLSEHSVVFSVDDGYHSVFTTVYPLLKQYGMTMTLGVIGNYVDKGAPSYEPASRFMHRSEIQELVDSLGIEIASHSLSHPFLTRLDSAAAWQEISGSKVLLESLFGVNVVTFAYPYGDMNQRVREMTRVAGYRMGRAVRPGLPNFWVDPFRLPTVELRTDVRLDSLEQLIAERSVTIILVHQILESPVAYTQWSLADFRNLVDWLDRTGVQVTTLAALYQEWWYRKMGRFMEQVAAAYPHERKRLLFEDVDVDATKAPHP
jgi:peptidoglycan/xylan/chitin deacetylase (PgdA/CDA1 family)